MGVHKNIFHIIAILCLIPNILCQVDEDLAVKNFRDYLKINTAHPDPDYEAAIVWIEQQANDIGLEYHITRFNEDKAAFSIWLTWPGLDPTLPSLFLNSHIDVVAVDPEWEHDPFAAEIDDEGNIYARGSQDMKSVGVQYLEAIRSLKAKGVTPGRTVHVGFIPDEEMGGPKGIKLFINTPEFVNLNIGFVLDEGLPSDDPDEVSIYYAQKLLVWTKFTALGETGHGSLLLENTAAEKILKVINKLMTLRAKEKARMEANSTLHLGDVTSVNLNVLEGGLEANIIPPKFSATFDLRITAGSTYNEVMKYLKDTCDEAGPNVTYEIIHTSLQPDQEHALTELDENSWWWRGIQTALDSLNLTAVPRVFPAGTDGQVTRSIGIPTLGFSPIFNTTMRFHSRDEYLNKEVFLQGIRIYEELIDDLVYVYVPTTPTTTPEPPTTDNSHHLVEEDNNATAATPTDKPSHGKSTAAKSYETSVFVSISAFLFYYVFTTAGAQ